LGTPAAPFTVRLTSITLYPAGLGFYVLYKAGKQIGLLEAISYSISLTLVLVPTAATVLYFTGVGIAMTGAALGLAVIPASILSFVFRKK